MNNNTAGNSNKELLDKTKPCPECGHPISKTNLSIKLSTGQIISPVCPRCSREED